MTTTSSVFLTAVSPSFTDAERQDILRDAASSSPSVSSEDEAADAPAPEAPVAQYADIKAYEETPRWRRKNLPWAGGQDNSDDYDTDLEDDFPPGKDTGDDLTSKEKLGPILLPIFFSSRLKGDGKSVLL